MDNLRFRKQLRSMKIIWGKQILEKHKDLQDREMAYLWSRVILLGGTMALGIFLIWKIIFH